ncbi:hypothetical protein [Phenylobacterium sp. SCN 70-31]|uniref:hypothetical protein n=1 Tax=Phenylobacterium sp. SCN 70-31 TaxID=1660129 RepID=UPI00086C7653|nr:hypothetical protein [Phenylobacterium sp. SCN 70-31]ODT87801.1 MAG: hypothetical protein ABS78_10585 [Phenylobacterium sp. SCN 70-31]
MTTNETRREVMATAWGLFRADPARTFADALTGAWRWVKGAAARAAQNAAWAARMAGRTVVFGSMLQSPIRRRVGTGWDAYKAERVTVALGH